MKLVYCVEDDEGIRELVSCALKSGGYEPIGFGTAKQFFDQIQKELPELIILDIMLPDESGISILKKLKENTAYSKIPIIMLTAKTAEIDKVVALETGADDYITKPFGIMEFLSRVKAVLRRVNKNEEISDSIFVLNDLSVDTQKRTVLYKESEIYLTLKEFDLLVYLLKNKDLVVSRSDILEKIWGFNYQGETRTVDMHIKTLRQKLESSGCIDMIQTVRGIGYKIQ